MILQQTEPKSAPGHVDNLNPINPAVVDLGAGRDEVGLFAGWKEEIDELLRARYRFTLLLQPSELALELDQVAAYYTVAVKNGPAFFSEARNGAAEATIFLDAVCPPLGGIPIHHPYGAAPADVDAARARVRIAIDRGLFDENGAETAFLARYWRALPAIGGGVAPAPDPFADADGNIPEAIGAARRALDPFLAQRAEADRGGLVIADYLDCLYNLLEACRPGSVRQDLLADVIATTVSVCKMGTITDDKAAKMMESIHDENNLDVDLDPERLKDIFRLLGPAIRAANLEMGPILSNLAAVFDFDAYMRIHLTIMQTLGVRASALNICLQAISMYPQHEVWAFLNQRCPMEMLAFQDAAVQLGNNPLVSFGSHANTEAIKGTRFPSLVAASVSLLKTNAKIRTLRGYGGRFQSPHAAMIDAIIQLVNEQLEDDIDLATFRDQSLVYFRM